MKLEAESTVFNDERIVTDVSNAQSTADDAQETASAAKEIADNTVQHFWFVGEGTDTGVHITEVPQSSFVDNPSGGNLLARSNGIAVRDGLTELARFGAASAQIGQDGQSHIEMDYRSMKMVDRDDTTFMQVIDLREAGSNLLTRTEETVVPSGVTGLHISLQSPAIDTSYTVKKNGVVTTSIIGKTTGGFNVMNVTGGDIISVTYVTETDDTKAYTFGIRDDGQIGLMSFAEGYMVVSSGDSSHAEGKNTVASGAAAHAEGTNTEATGYGAHAEGSRTVASGVCSHASGEDTIAAGSEQTVIGQCNIEHASDNALFVIGRGYNTAARSDAFVVYRNGKITSYLDHNGSASADATSGEDKDLFNAIRALGWYSDVIE